MIWGATPPIDSTTPVTPALLPAQGRQRDGTGQSNPPPYRPPPAAQTGGTAHAPPPPQPAPWHTNATDPPRGAQPPQGVRAEGTEKGPHTRRPAPTTRGLRTPTARPLGGQSGEGERLTPDAPRNSRRHPPRGRPAAIPTTSSQVEGNQDRTAPPQARQTEQGTGAGHAEGHGPRGTALPAPSAGTTRGAHATPTRGGGADAAGARAHTHEKGTRGLPEGQPDRARGTNRPPGMAYQRARVGDTRTGRHNTRCRPEPPEPAASAAHTQTGHCTRQGSSGAQRHAPTPRLGSLRASPRGSHWRQASSTGPAAPAPWATTH